MTGTGTATRAVSSWLFVNKLFYTIIFGNSNIAPRCILIFLPPTNKVCEGSVFTGGGCVCLCPRGGLCPGGGFHPGESLSRGVSGGLCLGVSVQGRGSLSGRVSVQGGLCSRGSLCVGVSVRENPPPRKGPRPSYGNEQAVRILLECIFVNILLAASRKENCWCLPSGKSSKKAYCNTIEFRSKL